MRRSNRAAVFKHWSNVDNKRFDECFIRSRDRKHLDSRYDRAIALCTMLLMCAENFNSLSTVTPRSTTVSQIGSGLVLSMLYSANRAGVRCVVPTFRAWHFSMLMPSCHVSAQSTSRSMFCCSQRISIGAFQPNYRLPSDSLCACLPLNNSG